MLSVPYQLAVTAIRNGKLERTVFRNEEERDRLYTPFDELLRQLREYVARERCTLQELKVTNQKETGAWVANIGMTAKIRDAFLEKCPRGHGHFPPDPDEEPEKEPEYDYGRCPVCRNPNGAGHQSRCRQLSSLHERIELLVAHVDAQDRRAKAMEWRIAQQNRRIEAQAAEIRELKAGNIADALEPVTA